MTMDHGQGNYGGNDGIAIVSRIKSWMRDNKVSMQTLNAHGVSADTMRQLGDQCDDHLMENMGLIQKVAAVIGAPLDYVLTGSMLLDISWVRAQRLKAWEYVDQFCKRMGLSIRETNKFSIWTMQQVEKRLAAPSLDRFKINEGIPQSITDVKEYYSQWLDQKRSK
ncbi:MAG: hypothetical protein WC058_10965 [Phycisphaeraceae bacterium]